MPHPKLLLDRLRRIGQLLLAAAATAAPAAAQPPADVNRDTVYQETMRTRSDTLAKLTPVHEAAMREPAEGDWLMSRRTYNGHGFSPLKQIDRDTVARLTLTWTRNLAPSPNEITPVAHDGVLFVASGGRIEAIDGATGELLWRYVRPRIATAQAASSIVRGIALYDNLVIAPTSDRHEVALDMKTGRVMWDHEVVSASIPGPRLSAGPIVANGKVIQGVSGCNGVKGGCYLVGLDAKTGSEVWRFQTLAQPGQPGGDSWNGAPEDERFGGSVWIAPSYDPDLDLVYVGVGQTYDAATLLQPHERKGESADALYTDSTLALDPDTGRLAWHYQHFSRDVWDLDWSFERTLIDLPTKDGVDRISLTGGKIAIFDAVDRRNGQYLFSRDLGLQTLIKSIDPTTGRKTIDPALEPMPDKSQPLCPDAIGARNWPATAYDSATHILYVPLVESCMDYTWKPRNRDDTAAGGTDMIWLLRVPPKSDGKFGRVVAINVSTGEVIWTRRQRAPESSSLLATAGGLVFEGSRDRLFRALDSRTGKVMWSAGLNASPSSTPITYSAHGQQYVAVVAGGGGPLDVSLGALTPELDIQSDGTTLWVFKIPFASHSRRTLHAGTTARP